MQYDTHADWEAAGVLLAQARNMTPGAVRFYVGTRDGREVFRALSRTTHRYEHEVIYTPRADRVEHCTCEARGVCWHIGVTRLWIERRKAQTERVEVAA
jgi:hypothetical protein